ILGDERGGIVVSHLDQAFAVAVLRLRPGGHRNREGGGEKHLHPHVGHPSLVRASWRPGCYRIIGPDEAAGKPLASMAATRSKGGDDTRGASDDGTASTQGTGIGERGGCGPCSGTRRSDRVRRTCAPGAA